MSNSHIVAGADYDPTAGELLHDEKGAAITTEYAEHAAREAEAGYETDQLIVRGRPSLSGDGDSPQVRFRVPTALRERAQAQAQAEPESVKSNETVAVSLFGCRGRAG